MKIIALKCRGFGLDKVNNVYFLIINPEFLVQQGEILYCKKRGVTKCCYQGEKCRLTPYVGDREEILFK